MWYTRKDGCEDQGVNGKAGFAHATQYWGTFTVLPGISGVWLGLHVLQSSNVLLSTCLCRVCCTRQLRSNILYCIYLSRRQWDAKEILCGCSYRLLFHPIWTKLEFCWHNLVNTHNLKLQQNPSNGGWVVPCGKTDGRAVTVAKVTVVFRSCCTDASKMDLKWIGRVPGIGLKESVIGWATDWTVRG